MALLRAVTFVPEVPVKRWLVADPATISIPEAKPASQLESDHADISSSESLRRVSSPTESLSVASHSIEQSAADSLEVTQASTTDDSDLLNSLNSEQALILSQASSQGMEQSVALVPPLKAVTAQGLASEAPNSIETESVEAEPVKAESVVVEASTANTEVNGIEPQPQLVESSVADSQSDSIRGTEPQMAPESVSEQSVSELSMPETRVTSTDSMPDEYYAAQDAQIGAYDDEPMSMDEYLPFDSLAKGSPSATDNESDRGNHSVATSPAPSGAEDDILNAVLAARDSLLTELVESEPKESGGKKPEAERQSFVPPTRKPALSEPDETSSVDNGQQDLSDQLDTQDSKVTDSQIEDRPPWEEQESSVSLNGDASKVEKKFSATGHDDAAEGEESHLEQEGETQLQTQNQPQTQSHSSTVVLNHNEAPVRAESMSVQAVVLNDGEVTGHDIDLKWYRLMAALDVGGRVRQLAVNSICHDFVVPMSLLLKPNQKHLAADIAIVQLEEALSRALGNETKVAIEVGVDDVRETPLEIRQRFHRELLVQAQQGLMSDSNIQWLMSQMDAEFENDSLSYNPELLSLKGNIIELIDKSNFKTLTES